MQVRSQYTSIYLQVLFNYGPNYVTTYCNPVGTSYLAQSTTAPGFSIPNSNPPQPVSPVASALSRALQYARSMHAYALPVKTTVAKCASCVCTVPGSFHVAG